MKKVVNIHFKGFTFQFEEDAYKAINQYMDEIGRYMGNIEGKDEILEDVQARIAEILHGKTKAGKTVFSMEDVEDLKARLGNPSDFAEEIDPDMDPEESKRKLFADPRGEMIGGVCSGLSTYFEVDVIWFRILFVLLVIMGSLGFWLYVILWIFLPRPKSAADFLQMEGKAPTLENMKSAFSGGSPEMDKVKEHFQNFRTKVKEKEIDSKIRNVLNNGGRGLRAVLLTLGKIIGFIIIILTGLALISFTAATLGMGGFWNLYPFSEADWMFTDTYPHPLWPEGSFPLLGAVSIVSLIAVPLISWLYGGFLLVNKNRFKVQGLGLALGILFVLSVSLAFYSAIDFGKHISRSAHTKTTMGITLEADTLFVESSSSEILIQPRNNHHMDFFESYAIENDLIEARAIEFDIQPSNADTTYLRMNFSALGLDRKEAMRRAQNIVNQLNWDGKTLDIRNTIEFPLEDQIRGQHLKMTLFLGTNKTVYLDPSASMIIYDIDNTTNTHDRFMTNKYWTMLPAGLTCLSCNKKQI